MRPRWRPFAWFAYLASDFFAMLTGPAPALRIVLALPVIGAVVTIAGAVAALRQRRARAGSLGSRLRYTALVITALLFTWSLHTWNLLGWRF